VVLAKIVPDSEYYAAAPEIAATQRNI